MRPEPFGALLYHFGTRKLSFLKNRTIVEVVNSLAITPTPDPPAAPRESTTPQQAPYLHALVCSSSPRCWSARRCHDTVHAGDATGAPAGRAVRARAGRADLPDLGADLRLQPGLRALPVVVGQARSARAVHAAVQGHHRRARTHAGVLREHRRRRTHCAAGLLGARRLRHRAPRRGQVLHQRRAHHAGGGGEAGRQRLRRRADLAGRRHRRGQRRGARSRVLRHGDARAGEPRRQPASPTPRSRSW